MKHHGKPDAAPTSIQGGCVLLASTLQSTGTWVHTADGDEFMTLHVATATPKNGGPPANAAACNGAADDNLNGWIRVDIGSRMHSLWAVSYTHLTLPTTPYV